MTKINTMGTKSCATIALSDFGKDQIDLNEQYNADPNSFKEPDQSVDWFYKNVLYPIKQELGRTDNYPFDLLMKRIDEGKMNSKFIITTLNAFQQELMDGYWANKLKEHGFELIDKTKNSIGSINFIYTRNPSRVD